MYSAAWQGHTDIVSLLIEAHGIVDLCEKVISKNNLMQCTDKPPCILIIEVTSVVVMFLACTFAH